MRWALERGIPEWIDGYGSVRPYTGPFDNLGFVTRTGVNMRSARPGEGKLLPDLGSAIAACGLRDGATISFHHHLRNGDGVLNAVVGEIAKLGLRDIKIAASSLFPVHAPLVEYVCRGIITGLYTSYMVGPVADAISRGALAAPVVMHTHGGRARALESGDLHIDVAFVAAPTADMYGNLNGSGGWAACGPLGYAVADAECADWVVAVTDNLVSYPACPIEIPQHRVDYVVRVETIGDASQILSGTTRVTTNPVGRRIAADAARVIEASGLLQDGFSFQTGAGGVSLAVAECLGQIMAQKGVRGSFAAGGITGGIVDMFDAGLFRVLFDVQCFDHQGIESYRRSAAHQAMSASMYANPHNRGSVVNQLDTMVLGAAEIDLDFNVNVTTASNGIIIGGSGGHSDTAAGAKLTLVTTQLTAARYPKIVDRVTTVTTPGETVDVLVTDEGVAVNPRRHDLHDRLTSAGITIASLASLRETARRRIGGVPEKPQLAAGRIIAVVEYRDGTVIDVVKSVG